MDSELRNHPMVFVEDMSVPELSPEDRVHLSRSLRLRDGDLLTIADGRGSWQQARMGESVEPVGALNVEAQPQPALSIGFSLVKGERSDLVVQKLTELGINRITPIVTERCVVRWDQVKVQKNLARHQRIVREAAMQSRNLWLPTVEPATPFTEFVRSFENGDDAAMILAEPNGGPLPAGATNLVIGPEGGFSPTELAGKSTAGLPGRILRSETAAITAAVLLAASR